LTHTSVTVSKQSASQILPKQVVNMATTARSVLGPNSEVYGLRVTVFWLCVWYVTYGILLECYITRFAQP